MDISLRRRRNPSSSNLNLERSYRSSNAGATIPSSGTAPGPSPRPYGLHTPNLTSLSVGRIGDVTAAGTTSGEPSSRGGRRPSQAVSSGLLQVPVAPIGADAIQRSARLSSQLRDRLEAIKRVAHAIRKCELSDITHRLLDSWSTSVQQLVLECDELVANLPTRIAEMDLSSRRGSGLAGHAAAIPPPAGASSGGSQRSPSTTTFEVPTPTQSLGATQSPPQPSVPLAAADAAGHPSRGGAAPTHYQPLATKTTVTTVSKTSGAVVPVNTIDHLIPDTGATAQILEVTTEGAAEKMRALALCLHATLDGACRSVNAQKATVFMPQRGVPTDLRSVCSVGFGGGENHTLYRPPSTSPEVLCMRTGILLACANGMNPPVELDMRAALAFFQHQASHAAGEADGDLTDGGGSVDLDALVESRARALQHIPQEAKDMFNFAVPQLSDTGTLPPRAPASGGKLPGPRSKRVNSDSTGGLAPSIVTSLKSRYWSKIVCPIRLNNSTPTLGVLTMLNKDDGNSNFSEEDELILFGVATALAGMLCRCTDIELLCRSYVPRLPLPTFPSHMLPAVTIPGSRNQLVYRTKDPSGGRELKILLDSGKAERLDGHTALISVADYIHQMQQSWRDAVLLNAELRRTHEDRTRMVTSLLVRARTSELKNTVMEQERVNMVPNDDEHNAQYFRDYAKYLKLKPLLQTLGEREEDVEQRLLAELTSTPESSAASRSAPQPKRKPMQVQPHSSGAGRLRPNDRTTRTPCDAGTPSKSKQSKTDDEVDSDNRDEDDEGNDDEDNDDDDDEHEEVAEGTDAEEQSTAPEDEGNGVGGGPASEDDDDRATCEDVVALPELHSDNGDALEAFPNEQGTDVKQSQALSPPSHSSNARATPRSAQSSTTPGALTPSQLREQAQAKHRTSREAQEILFGKQLPPPLE